MTIQNTIYARIFAILLAFPFDTANAVAADDEDPLPCTPPTAKPVDSGASDMAGSTSAAVAESVANLDNDEVTSSHGAGAGAVGTTSLTDVDAHENPTSEVSAVLVEVVRRLEAENALDNPWKWVIALDEILKSQKDRSLIVINDKLLENNEKAKMACAQALGFHRIPGFCFTIRWFVEELEPEW